MLFNGVIPITMKGVRMKIERFNFNVRHLDPFRIMIRIQGCADFKPSASCCGLYQIDDHLVINEGAATPVQAGSSSKHVEFIARVATPPVGSIYG
jgi:hypothetical protein